MSNHQNQRPAASPVMSDSYQVAHVVTLLVLTLLAIITVALRFWARQIQKQALALNDYLIVLGLIFALGETGTNVYACCFPSQWKSSAQSANITLELQLIFLSPIIWVIAVTFIRASIISLYMHVFPMRVFRITCYGILLLNMAFLTATVLADCLICRPIQGKWDIGLKGATCGNEEKLSLFIATVNFLQDFIVVVLPMPVLWHLNMVVSRKAALTGMFGMGILICAVTIYRIQVTATTGDRSSPSSQEQYALIALLTSLETLLGIMTACLPILKPIGRRLWASLPKRGSDKAKLSTSGTIPIMMRISQMLTASSRKRSSRDRDSSPDRLWHEVQAGEKWTDHVSLTPKAGLKMESTVVEIPAGRNEGI